MGSCLERNIKEIDLRLGHRWKHIDNYLSALNRDDLDFYYKYHPHGSHKIYNEEII